MIPDIRQSAALFEGFQDSPVCLSDKSSNIKVQFVTRREQWAAIIMTGRLMLYGGLNGFDCENHAICTIEWQQLFLMLKQAVHTLTTGIQTA
jgi:hypothetical protein